MTRDQHKAAWAARRADDARRQAQDLRTASCADWRARQRRDEAVRYLEAEAHRFGILASRLRRAA